MNTTLNQLNSFQPSQIDFDALLAYLGKTAPDDEVLPITTCIDALGIQGAVWCLKGVLPNDATNKRKVELYALYCLGMLSKYYGANIFDFNNTIHASYVVPMDTFIRSAKTDANLATLKAVYPNALNYANTRRTIASQNPSSSQVVKRAETANSLLGLMVALIDRESIGYTSGEMAAAQANITALVLTDADAAWELMEIELVRVCNGGTQ